MSIGNGVSLLAVAVTALLFPLRTPAQSPFSHRIEIKLPKGANGMQPDLRLVFAPYHADRIYGLERSADLSAGSWEPLDAPSVLPLPNGTAALLLPLAAPGSAFFRLTVNWSQ